MEAAVRWSPHSTDDRQRFLLLDIANQSLVLHQVDELSKTRIRHHPIARSPKVPAFSSFDWSKSQESINALGHVSGTASLVKLYDDGKPSEIAATFRLKQQRKCNSVAFSSQDWLAVGVDKTRSDVCLLVYDVTRDQLAEPVRKLCAAEVVNSVRFFTEQPKTLVAGTSRAYIRIYDLRDGFYGTGSSTQAATKCVNNIAIDPLNECYFASCGSTDDPTVMVWDRRAMPQSAAAGSSNGAVFEFKPTAGGSSRSTIWSLRFSGQSRGKLGICSSTGEVRVIDMKEGKVLASQANPYAAHSGYASSFPNDAQWLNPSYGAAITANKPYVSVYRTIEPASHDNRDAQKRLIAFDWVPHMLGALTHPMIALRASREVEVLSVPAQHVQAQLTGRNEVGIASRDVNQTEARHILQPTATRTTHDQPAQNQPEDFGPHDRGGGTEFSLEDETAISSLEDPKLQRLLATSDLYRTRCQQGYLFNCTKNARIVASNWPLERLWEIINRFQEQAPTMTHHRSNLNLAYIGIKSLWLEDVANLHARRVTPTAKPARMRDAITGLNRAAHLPAFEGERTSFPEHRQLCLRLCGWKFTQDTLEAECNELIDRGLHYQAIVQAVLHGATHTALNLLRSLIRSRTIPNIGLGALLASDRINAEQREMCLWMAADTDDAALKALLAYLVSGDWRDVMKTPYLHLGYRLALGLKYLNDTELSGFIASETARAVRNGDVEGILLTGLGGEQAMDLLQTYVTRTGDVQTAVLATAFAYPGFGHDDVRWEAWRETYFEMMQRWRCFTQRAVFVVQHARMARARGAEEETHAKKQVVVRCAHCQGDVTGTKRSSTTDRRTVSRENIAAVKRVPGPAAHAGTVCMQCGRHLPRCAICKLWLGTPHTQHPQKQQTKPQQHQHTRTKSGGIGVPHSPGKATASPSAEINGRLEQAEPATSRDVPAQQDAHRDGAGGPNIHDSQLANLLTFCARCGHGYHAHHAKMWFARSSACAVPECGCLCRM